MQTDCPMICWLDVQKTFNLTYLKFAAMHNFVLWQLGFYIPGSNTTFFKSIERMCKLANLETRLQIVLSNRQRLVYEKYDWFIYEGVLISMNTTLQNNSYPLKHEMSSDPVYVYK